MLLVPSPTAAPESATACLARIVAAHARIDSPHVARVADHDLAVGRAFIRFDCPAVIDGVDAFRSFADQGEKLSYVVADTLFTRVRTVFQTARNVLDETTGRPYAIGALSLANLTIGDGGELHVFGYGHDFPNVHEDGRVEATDGIFLATEVAMGEPPSPDGDYVALLMLVRSLVQFCEMPEGLVRVLTGRVLGGDTRLIELVRWFSTAMIGQMAGARPTMDQAVARSAEVRALLGTTLDDAALATVLARVAETAVGVRDDAPEVGGGIRRLRIALREGRVELDGRSVRLGNATLRMLAALAEQRHRVGDEPLSTWALFDAGWPGEHPLVEAGANRVYVSLSRLRSQGLRDVLERTGDGYRLTRGFEVELVR